MKIFKLEDNIPIELQQKLFAFEKLFDYPLENNILFRIDHSPDYKAFYQAIGKQNIIIAEKENQIIAIISTSIRDIEINGKKEKVAYIGDLKIHPDHRANRLLYKLAYYLKPILEQEVSLAYGVVMEGTNITPDNYTGRLGIPSFTAQAKIHLIRFITQDYSEEQAEITSEDFGYKLYCELNKNSFTISNSRSKLRSLIAPIWFKYNDQACAMVEDTRRAKKLFLANDMELVSAHISYFSYADYTSAAILLRQCIGYAYKHDYPAILLALSGKQRIALDEILKQFSYQESFAIIYANDQIFKNITINSSEI